MATPASDLNAGAPPAFRWFLNAVDRLGRFLKNRLIDWLDLEEVGKMIAKTTDQAVGKVGLDVAKFHATTKRRPKLDSR